VYMQTLAGSNRADEAEKLAYDLLKNENYFFNDKMDTVDIDGILTGDVGVVVFVDFDEIAALIKAAEYMTTTAVEWKGQIKEFTETMYTTKSDFKFGFFQRGMQQTAFVSVCPGGENYILRSVQDLKLIGENAAKCVTKLNEKQESH